MKRNGMVGYATHTSTPHSYSPDPKLKVTARRLKNLRLGRRRSPRPISRFTNLRQAKQPLNLDS